MMKRGEKEREVKEKGLKQGGIKAVLKPLIPKLCLDYKSWPPPDLIHVLSPALRPFVL